jgi:DNA-binding response OmpR family regulator
MKLLIIEDDQEIVRLLKTSLKKEIFMTDYSSDGKKGLFLFQTNYYDLLIIDYGLPNKNGQEIVKEVRRENKDVKIIVITVDVKPETREKFFELGIDDFITKPFAFSELLSRIKAVMRRPNKIQNSIYKIDGLMVDVDRHLAVRDKESIYLTFKEMMMLEYFLKNKGKIISRTALMENIWDLNADPFSNTVETHILKLRRKLNPSKSKGELIHTIKGRGYKLDTKKW